jgi:hypothetical protein
MARRITGRAVFAGVIGLALLSGVLAVDLQRIQSTQLAWAGATNVGPAGACEPVNSLDDQIDRDRSELICWTGDFTLSVPEPGVR